MRPVFWSCASILQVDPVELEVGHRPRTIRVVHEPYAAVLASASALTAGAHVGSSSTSSSVLMTGENLLHLVARCSSEAGAKPMMCVAEGAEDHPIPHSRGRTARSGRPSAGVEAALGAPCRRPARWRPASRDRARRRPADVPQRLEPGSEARRDRLAVREHAAFCVEPQHLQADSGADRMGRIGGAMSDRRSRCGAIGDALRRRAPTSAPRPSGT